MRAVHSALLFTKAAKPETVYEWQPAKSPTRRIVLYLPDKRNDPTTIQIKQRLKQNFGKLKNLLFD